VRPCRALGTLGASSFLALALGATLACSGPLAAPLPVESSSSPASSPSIEPAPKRLEEGSPRSSTKARPPLCRDQLAQLLARAGWASRKQNRIAWAVVMRESRGIETQISNGQDIGLFQLNRTAWGSSSWWDEQLLLEGSYNARAARKLWQRHGWQPWGLTLDGQLDTSSYGSWSSWQISAWIWEPFQLWSSRYPCEGRRLPT
jgi:hypothetical protein